MTTEPASPSTPEDAPLDMASGVAAPLLAAISFTLVTLTLQLRRTDARYLNIALLLFVGAGLSFITTVQAGMWELRYRAGASPNASQAKRYEHKRWDYLTRNSYHAGILALLAAIGVLLVPPGTIPNVRIATIALTGAGLVGELLWIRMGWVRTRAAERRLAEMGPAPGSQPVEQQPQQPVDEILSPPAGTILLSVPDDVDRDVDFQWVSAPAGSIELLVPIDVGRNVFLHRVKGGGDPPPQ